MSEHVAPPKDTYATRCPRLGHQVPFSYCRGENSGLPCFKTLDCWHEHFSVETWLRQTLSPEEWDRAFGSRPKPKMQSLLELVEQAKERKKETSS